MVSLRRRLGLSLRRARIPIRGDFVVSAMDVVRPRRILGDGSPFGVYAHWRRLTRDIAPDEILPEHGLPSMRHNYPGKHDRMVMVRQFLAATRGVSGDVIEFGCFRGMTATHIAHHLASEPGAPPTLHLLDSFQGMPKSDHPDDQDPRLTPGVLTADEGEVRQRFSRYPNVKIYAGWFEDTIPTVKADAIRFAHVDADFYTSITTANAWLLGRVQRGGIIVYDDYAFESCHGARRAVDETFAKRDDYWGFSLPTGQYVAVRR